MAIKSTVGGRVCANLCIKIEQAQEEALYKSANTYFPIIAIVRSYIN